MTPEELAQMHGKCFTVPRPWSASEFQNLLADPKVFLICAPNGFILGRTVAGEAELLTLAVDPSARRQGTGQTLVAAYHSEARKHGATESFLEVASGNAAARALYSSAGYAQAGVRKGYYRREGGQSDDALVLRKPLN